ncbi:DUF2975 domain-containing protein [Marinilactibacillus sp. GCM10026970]|uniref:DUF2975 domain-containing protein n=1 Tax=Marinilactibacillus sp. GCM10026970 TaxID=3252642 RepID=UPI00360C50A8
MKIRTIVLKITLGILAIGTIGFNFLVLPWVTNLLQITLPHMTILHPLTQGALIITGVCFLFMLAQSFKLIVHIDENEAFSVSTISCLKNIRNAASIMTGIYLLLLPIVYLVADRDDAPGLILVGLFFLFFSAVIVAFADVLNILFSNARAYKLENDLTI